MSTATIAIKLSDGILEWVDGGGYVPRSWEFEDAAEGNGWTSIGMICEPLGGPVSSNKTSRYYGDNTARYAQAVSNAEEIERILNEADTLSDGCDWAWGPAESFIFNADNPHMVKAAEGIECALSDHGYLNEERASEIEYEENHPSETECYADGGCECYVNTHECSEVMWSGVDSGDLSLATDDEWFCMYCDQGYEITDATREEFAMREFRRMLADAEAAGQGRIF